MGLRFRRSITLVKGIRLNVSKSGYSWSFGGAPYTVNISQRGTYRTFSLPGTGLSYREKGGGHAPQTVQRNPPTQEIGTPESYVHLDETASSSEQMVADINERLAKPRWAWIGVAGAALTLPGIEANPALLLLTFGFVALAAVLHNQDRRRRTTQIAYDFDTEGQHGYLRLGVWLDNLMQSQRTWLVHSSLTTKDWKRNAGANALVNRQTVRFRHNVKPPFVETNIAVQTLRVGTAALYFLPDQILVYQRRRYAAFSYDSLTQQTSVVRFRETEGVPSDSRTVGTTWQFVRVDGGPDRRFNNNRQIPIALYVEVTFAAGTALRVTLQLSKSDAAAPIQEAFRRMKGADESGHTRLTAQAAM